MGYTCHTMQQVKLIRSCFVQTEAVNKYVCTPHHTEYDSRPTWYSFDYDVTMIMTQVCRKSPFVVPAAVVKQSAKVHEPLVLTSHTLFLEWLNPVYSEWLLLS